MRYRQALCAGGAWDGSSDEHGEMSASYVGFVCRLRGDLDLRIRLMQIPKFAALERRQMAIDDRAGCRLASKDYIRHNSDVPRPAGGDFPPVQRPVVSTAGRQFKAAGRQQAARAAGPPHPPARDCCSLQVHSNKEPQPRTKGSLRKSQGQAEQNLETQKRVLVPTGQTSYRLDGAT